MIPAPGGMGSLPPHGWPGVSLLLLGGIAICDFCLNAAARATVPEMVLTY